jgi:hypothetical protein
LRVADFPPKWQTAAEGKAPLMFAHRKAAR